MAAILVQDNVGSVIVYAQNSAGNPVTGLADTDVTADVKKTSGSFSAYALTPTNWTELSGGFYEISLTTAITDTLGNLYVRVQGAAIRTTVVSAYVIDVVPVTPPTVTPPSTVTVFGYVYGVDARPVQGASVRAKVLGVPTILHPGADGLTISQGIVTVQTDSDGFFTLDLIQGTSVDISIGAANYRRTFVVPSVSTNLFDIP